MTFILVVAAFIILITAGMIVQRVRTPQRVRIPGSSPVTTGIDQTDFRLPKGVYFHPGHTWVSLLNDGSVRIGIDDFISKLTGPVQGIEIPEIGAEVEQGEPALKIKFDSKILHLPIPISGTVKKINQLFVEQPSKIGTKALAHEWLIDIAPANLSAEVNRLSIAEQVGAWITGEMERIKEFLVSQSGRPELVSATLPDGGEPVQGVLNMLDKEGIQQFEKTFLQTK